MSMSDVIQQQVATIMVEMKNDAKYKKSAVSRRIKSVIKHEFIDDCIMYLVEWNHEDVGKPEHRREWISLDDALINNNSVVKAIRQYWYKLSKIDCLITVCLDRQ